MPSLICLDASVVVQILANPANVAIQQQWERWHTEEARFVAPVLQRYEVTNALHRYQQSGTFNVERVEDILKVFLQLPISYADDPNDHRRAMELARQLHRPASNDAHYLALAERLGIEFWTADRKLANAVQHVLQWVRLIE